MLNRKSVGQWAGGSTRRSVSGSLRGKITYEEWVDRKLGECNEMDLSGVFERFVRTRECKGQED